MDWWNISVFGVIPILSVTVIFCIKRKFLWTAPVISTALSVAVSIIAMPSILSDSEHRNMFFGIGIPMHFVIAAAWTVIAYLAARALKPK